jgi:hypothetical protein
MIWHIGCLQIEKTPRPDHRKHHRDRAGTDAGRRLIMSRRKTDQKSQRQQGNTQGAGSQATDQDIRFARKALPKGSGGPGTGRVDVTGIVPEDIHMDPDITEGHPGY